MSYVCKLPGCERPLRGRNSTGYCGSHRHKHPRVAAANNKRTNAYYADNKDLVFAKWCVRRYGVTAEYLRELHSRQLGLCACCSIEVPAPGSGVRGCHVDHCHTTQKATGVIVVRGILCPQCNIGLGHFDDSVKRLRQATTYLEKHNVG